MTDNSEDLGRLIVSAFCPHCHRMHSQLYTDIGERQDLCRRKSEWGIIISVRLFISSQGENAYSASFIEVSVVTHSIFPTDSTTVVWYVAAIYLFLNS